VDAAVVVADSVAADVVAVVAATNSFFEAAEIDNQKSIMKASGNRGFFIRKEV
jgi:hypothetical protein